MMHDPVSVALSNLWVLNSRTTSSVLLNTWILTNDRSDILQEVSVSSSAYSPATIPKSVANFLQKVSMLEDQSIATRTAKQMLRKYIPTIAPKKRTQAKETEIEENEKEEAETTEAKDTREG